MPTLLHLSDLRRSPDEPIDNDTLLASVVTDVDRFSLNNERPEALVVSGDLVQGVAVATSGYEQAMADQYRNAFDLIGRLCQELLGGDRSKVVVVPGNHDVCWNTSTASMEPVADDRYPKDLRRALGERNGPFRWSWRDRHLYRVTADATYKRRLAFYWDAVESFYNGVDLPLPIDRTRGFHLFSLFDDQAVFAGFETTHRNDHLRGEAELSTGVVSRCAMHLRSLGSRPALTAAVWHHSVHGPPNRDDYLNVDVIREMAGLGFQIGFHGHQHLAESTDLTVSVGGGSSMCIVSAGSLCAGWRDLPRGTDRQYNIVRFDPSFERGTLHLREMAEGNQFISRARGRFLGGEVPLTWTGRPGAATAADRSETRLREVTSAVEEATRRGLSTAATAELVGLRPTAGTYPRKILLRALQHDKAWSVILETFQTSEGVDETVAIAESAFRDNNIEILEAVLEQDSLPPASRDHFEARRALLQARRGNG